MKQTYLVDQQRYPLDGAGLQEALAIAHAAKLRPRCLCTHQGVEMYVAAMGGRLFVKRMPDSGSQHAAACPSFEPPEELSGLGQVARTAIVEDIEAGTTALKLGFSLSKVAGRSSAAASAQEHDSVHTDATKLGLRALLHYLWEQAGLSAWSPAMSGKRSWGVVRRALSEAVIAKIAKGQDLAARFFVPETFSTDRQVELEQARAAKLGRVYAASGKVRELMLLVGEVKAVVPARYGFKAVVKHLPDLPFMLDDVLARRMERRFVNELALWNADQSTHLIMIATFGRGAAGMLAIEELAFMLTTTNWLPIDNVHDQQLLAALTQAGRRFRRGLRYNLTTDRPVAVAITTDTRPRPVALYIVPPDATPAYRAALATLVADSSFPAWVWQAGTSAPPALPAINRCCPEIVNLEDASESGARGAGKGTEDGCDAE